MDPRLKSYYSPSDPGSFGGVSRLYRSLKQKGEDVKYEDVRRLLKTQNTYTLHKDKRTRFPTNRIVVFKQDEQWEIDIADLSLFARENGGIRYLLTVIDVFTKYLWLYPLKTKKPDGVVAALKAIIDTGRKPDKIRSDNGTEFVNKKMHDFLSEQDISHLLTTNKTYKAATAERVQRTMKGRFFRYFTRVGSHKYIDVLDDFVRGYNNSYHRTIKMTPVQALTANQKLVFQNTYGVREYVDVVRNKESKPRLRAGDTVRIAYDRGVFDKGFWRTFSDTTATVDKVIDRPRPMYLLKDHDGEKKRRFYEQELQGIPQPSYRIEKVLKRRVKNGKPQFFVKFVGYPSSENQWVEELEQV